MTVSRILIKQQIDKHYYFQAHIFASKITEISDLIE